MKMRVGDGEDEDKEVMEDGGEGENMQVHTRRIFG